MKAIIQRVSSASVIVDNKEISSINQGVLVLLGIHAKDTDKEIPYLVRKITNLRIFPSEKSFVDKSISDINGSILVVSQFTLYGDCTKGNRPSFTKAMPPDEAKVLYNKFVTELKKEFDAVQTGEFGADMKVQLINDGPVTIILEN